MAGMEKLEEKEKGSKPLPEERRDDDGRARGKRRARGGEGGREGKRVSSPLLEDLFLVLGLVDSELLVDVDLS